MRSRLFQRILRAYRFMRLAGQFLKKDIQLHGWRPSRTRWQYIRRGFHIDKRALYDPGPDGYPRPDYLSDFERLRTRYLNLGYHRVLNNKVLFSQVFPPFFRCPENYGLTSSRGLYTPLDPHAEHLRNIPLDQVIHSMPDRFVMKRMGGGGGIDIFVIEKENGRLSVNQQSTTAAQLETRLAARRFLLMEFIEQGRYGKELYPHTVNTVRIVTARDGDGPWIVYAVQRIGRKESEPTDNFNQGGLCCPIDIETGRIGKAMYYHRTQRPTLYSLHPDTGTRIEGRQVPQWETICRVLLNAMAQLPGFDYVGWDVIIQDDTFLVLEGNSYPGVQVLQLHTPLLADHRLARFFGEHRILPADRLSAIGIDPGTVQKRAPSMDDYDEGTLIP